MAHLTAYRLFHKAAFLGFLGAVLFLVPHVLAITAEFIARGLDPKFGGFREAHHFGSLAVGATAIATLLAVGRGLAYLSSFAQLRELAPGAYRAGAKGAWLPIHGLSRCEACGGTGFVTRLVRRHYTADSVRHSAISPADL